MKLLKCKAMVMGIDTHPSCNQLCAALVDGTVEFWEFGNDKSQRNLVFEVPVREEDASCRVVKYWTAPPGTSADLVTGYKNGDLVLFDQEGKEKWANNKAHSSPISALEWFDEHTVISGDDDGYMKIWDTREKGRTQKGLRDQLDYIASIKSVGGKNTILVASGDGTLGVYSTKLAATKLNLIEISKEQPDDLLCVEVVKNGKKVIVGTMEGLLAVWGWGNWENRENGFPGHPESISSILKFDENTICTGSADGLLRLVTVYPFKLEHVLGDQGDMKPIEGMSWGFDWRTIATTSHDSKIRIHDTSILIDEDDDEEEDNEAEAQADTKVESDAEDSDAEVGGGKDNSDSDSDSDSDEKDDEDDDDDDDDDDDEDKEEDEEGGESNKEKGESGQSQASKEKKQSSSLKTKASKGKAVVKRDRDSDSDDSDGGGDDASDDDMPNWGTSTTKSLAMNSKLAARQKRAKSFFSDL